MEKWQMIKMLMVTLARWDDHGRMVNQEETDEVSERVDFRGGVLPSKKTTGNFKEGSQAARQRQPCCKGDQPFQWETQKFDPLWFPNLLIFPHQKVHRWLRPAYLLLCKIWWKCVYGGASPHYTMSEELCWLCNGKVWIFKLWFVLFYIYNHDVTLTLYINWTVFFT